MKEETVFEALNSTGIHRERDTAVPINGKARQLPYMVIRTDESLDPADTGRVYVQTTTWTVALFTPQRDFALECKVVKAMAILGIKLEVEHFPDGNPYQTNFTFTTRNGGRNNA